MKEKIEGVTPQESMIEGKEIEFADGDTLKIKALTEILSKGEEVEERNIQLDPDQVTKLQQTLEKLPFRIGQKEHIGTFPRQTHELVIAFGSRMLEYNAPKEEKEKKLLALKFDQEISSYPLRIQTNSELLVESNMDDSRGPRNVIRFTPESSLIIANKEIEEIVIVLPLKTREKS